MTLAFQWDPGGTFPKRGTLCCAESPRRANQSNLLWFIYFQWAFYPGQGHGGSRASLRSIGCEDKINWLKRKQGTAPALCSEDWTPSLYLPRGFFGIPWTSNDWGFSEETIVEHISEIWTRWCLDSKPNTFIHDLHSFIFSKWFKY